MKEEIKNKILDLIGENQFVSTKEIQNKFEVSLMTANRWLKKLDQKSYIHKVHGGGVSIDSQAFSNNQNNDTNLKVKRVIAKYAAHTFIQPEQTYFFEAGNTVYEMLPYIKEKNITIITNSIQVIYSINKYSPEITVLSIGGIVRPQSMSIVGDVAESTLSKFRANVMFFSCSAVSEEGLFDSDLFECVIKRKMIAQSVRIILLVESSKINKTSAELFSTLDHIDDIVIESEPPENISKALEKHNVTLHIATQA